MNNRGNKIRKEKRNFPKAEIDPGYLCCKSPSGVSPPNDKNVIRRHILPGQIRIMRTQK